MPIRSEDLDNWFTYHRPSEAQQVAYASIRQAARDFANIVLHNTPSSADQTVAIRHIRDAVMVANASIACEGK